MQSGKVGVRSAILGKPPEACVSHCCSHNLNLSIVQYTNNQVINGIIEQYKALQIHLKLLQKEKVF